MYKINKEVFYRFEPNLGDEGELVVYFKEANEIYEMTEPFYIFMKGIENNHSFNQLINIYIDRYPQLKKMEIVDNMHKIEDKLRELRVIL